MIRVNVLVEGQTEETFVRDVLAPHYAYQNIFLIAIGALTSQGHKGGVVSYGKVKNQITKLCRRDRQVYVTSMIDFYGLPQDFPGKNDPNFLVINDIYQKAQYLEACFRADINEINFIPNFLLHEFEALLLCQPTKFSEFIDGVDVNSLQEITNGFPTPEHINDSPETAPSKRILNLIPRYKKTLHGPMIAADIGLDVIRQNCIHFGRWLTNIEALANS